MRWKFKKQLLVWNYKSLDDYLALVFLTGNTVRDVTSKNLCICNNIHQTDSYDDVLNDCVLW